jgi:hypothetical protein
MKNVTYSWSRSFNVPAQVVGEFFYGLRKRTPEELVKASRSPKAPTHGLFEWNDSAAARAFRLVQARVIVASLQVEITTLKGRKESVRAYIGSSDRGSYVATLEANDDDLTEAEQECVEAMRRFKQRWRGLQFAREVIHAMNAAEQRAARKVKFKKAA